MSSITHIVLFRYRHNIPWTDLESHFHDFAQLKQTCLKDGKPYMLSMQMGKNHSWEPYSKGMTHAFVLEFASVEDRDYYLLSDPVHHAFSAKAGPLIEDSLVMDMQNGQLFASMFPSSTTKPKPAMTGSCHCGNISFSVILETPQHVLCHCDTCKKLSGAPYSCNAIVPKDDLKITSGVPNVYSYTGASGKAVLCYFCPRCTSHIYHHQMAMPDKVIARTLLLDSGNKMGVGGEIFAEGGLGWVKDLRGALGQS